LSSNIHEKSLKSLDIDITYYIGSHWEVPNESLIPLRDIPILYYNSENKMTASPDATDSFVYALKTNLSQLIQFCSSLQKKINKRHLVYKQHYQRHISSKILNNKSIIR
jgi:hypothetical protein